MGVHSKDISFDEVHMMKIVVRITRHIWIGYELNLNTCENNAGNLLRSGFINEARNRGYEFVSSYVHRDVIGSRIDKGDAIEVLQKYVPDKLDYYRQDLSKI